MKTADVRFFCLWFFFSKVLKLFIVIIYAKTQLLKGGTEMALLSLLAQKDMNDDRTEAHPVKVGYFQL